MPESDIQTIFKLLDHNGDGTVTPNEFCDVIEGKVTPAFEAFVKKERAKKALEEERKQSKTAQAKFKSQNADLGSSQFARDEDVAD
jgi:Ca2+-binding EF-hand superfamily protein